MTDTTDTITKLLKRKDEKIAYLKRYIQLIVNNPENICNTCKKYCDIIEISDYNKNYCSRECYEN